MQQSLGNVLSALASLCQSTNPETSHSLSHWWVNTWIHVQILLGQDIAGWENCVLELACFFFPIKKHYPKCCKMETHLSPPHLQAQQPHFLPFSKRRSFTEAFLAVEHISLFLFFIFVLFCFAFTWSVPILVTKDKARHQQRRLLLYDLNDIFMLHHMG